MVTRLSKLPVAMLLERLTDASNLSILRNALSLIGTTAATTLLGFAYWWLAAKGFSTGDVGSASAAISIMSLLGIAGMSGLGTLLMGEIGNYPGREVGFVMAALVLSGAIGAALGFAFVVASTQVVPHLGYLGTEPALAGLFVAGAAFTALTMVLDQALVALLKGELQLVRNTIFATAKLILLVGVVYWFPSPSATLIPATWVAGTAVSLLVLLWIARSVTPLNGSLRPEWGALLHLRRNAIEHHVLNVALQVPSLSLPVLVTAALSAGANGYFYPSWMIVGAAFAGPVALSTSLYAVAARSPGYLPARMRFTLMASAFLGLATCATLWLCGDGILGMFGADYVREAASSLRVLVLGVFPLIVKDHYVVACRIDGHMGRAALIVLVGGIVELAAACIGAKLSGLGGLSVGWVLGVTAEAVVLAHPVYSVMTCTCALERFETQGERGKDVGTGLSRKSGA